MFFNHQGKKGTKKNSFFILVFFVPWWLTSITKCHGLPSDVDADLL